MIIHWIKINLFISYLIVSLPSFAAEVDQFSKRFYPLVDSSSLINDVANAYLLKSIDEANKSHHQCNEKILYKKMRNYFSNHLKGEVTIFSIKSPLVDKIKLKIKQSIFKEWDLKTGMLLGHPFTDTSKIVLSPLLKIGDQVIGTDKFEHLFGRGFAYFSDYYLKNKSLEQTLNSGYIQEKIVYGGNFIATGVFSYADLSANFNGMRFWNNVLLKRKDIMEEERKIGPYVICENQKFELHKKIDFKYYFDASHDEAINCSNFSNKRALTKINKSLADLNKTDKDHVYKCPMDEKILKEMVAKYGVFSKYIINEKGNGTINYLQKFDGSLN